MSIELLGFKMNFTDWFRVCLMTATIAICVILATRYIRSFKYASLGQKLYIGGSLCLLISLAIGNFESMQDGNGWRWRLLPSTIGVTLFLIYVLEPFDMSKKRWGRDVFGPKGPGEL